MSKILFGSEDGGKTFQKINDLSAAIQNYPIDMAFCDDKKGMILTQSHGYEEYAFLTEAEADERNGRVAPISETFEDLREVLQEG